MNEDLRGLLAAGRGVVSVVRARSVVPRHVVAHAVRSGQVVRPFPGALVAVEVVGQPMALWRAALIHAGPGAALSHLTALAAWGLPASDGPASGLRGGDQVVRGLPVGDRAAVHVMTGPGRRLRAAGLVAHRRAGFEAVPPQVMFRAGLPVTRLERSLVDAWPLGAAEAVRAAVAARLTTPDRIRAALAHVPNLAGRTALTDFLDRLDRVDDPGRRDRGDRPARLGGRWHSRAGSRYEDRLAG